MIRMKCSQRSRRRCTARCPSKTHRGGLQESREEFVADLDAIGFKISRAALYRIERGEQEPTASFLIASSILLFGETICPDLLNPCIPQEWADLLSSDAIMRIIGRNGVLASRKTKRNASIAERAARYDEIMNSLSSFDFNVFANRRCDDEHMFITVAYGAGGDEYGDLESYEITNREDVERAILNYLKAYGTSSGVEIAKLVDHSMKRLEPTLEDYGIE